MFFFIQARSGFALANSGFAFKGTTVFRCGIAAEGIAVFRNKMLPLIARRGRDCLKLILSAVCCSKFLTMWDLVSSALEVSFCAEAFEPYTIDIIMGTVSPLSTPVTDNINNLIDDRFRFFQRRSRQCLSHK